MMVRNWNDILSYHELSVETNHICNNNEDIDILVARCRSGIDNKKLWIVAKVWIADEEEVLDGEAEKIGEVKKISVIEINYCPFCGEHLNAV